MHWLAHYIGLPWALDPRPPKSFNCWSFVRWIQQHHYHRECPDYPIVNPLDHMLTAELVHRAEDSFQWKLLEVPEEGCIVGMSDGRTVHHVGIYTKVDTWQIAHCMDRVGVACHRPRLLGRVGLRVEKFYKHTTWDQQSH